MALLYEYEPLDLTSNPLYVSTRIIGLKPSTDFRATLQCEILAIRLLAVEQRPPYEAISYTWEGQKASPDHYILCQSENRKESKLLITKNADAALRGLRLNDKVRFLWIDSVCINQDSEIERNSQVENMGYIYKYARRVVVWLGEALNEGSSLTLKDMRMIATLDPDDASSREKLDDLFKQLLQDSELPKTKNLHLQVMDKWGLMGSFFQLPWFNRLWTLQEIVVNSNDALFYYGDQSIEWSTMKSALMLMQERFYDHSSPLNDTIGLYVEMQDDVQRWRSAWFSNPYMCDDCLNFGNLDLPKPQLSDILARARTRKCSDPKDKVFGLFGICQFLQVHMPTPDYGKSVEQIFFEVTKAIVDGEEDLSFLYEISGPIRNPRLPSWVPDWEHGWVHKVGAPLTKAEYYSAGGQKCQESVIIDAEIMMLKVRGKVIDVISQCHKSIPVFDNLPISSIFNAMHMAHMDLMEDLWSSWEAFCEWVQCVRQQFSESGDTMEAFNSTLLQGVDLPVGIESKNVQAAFDRWFLALVKTHEAVEKEEGQENKDKMNRNMCTRSLLDGDVDTPDMRMFHGNACLLSGGRSFFTTASCRMGTCQGEISEGDVVAVVAGLKLPLVLRPIGEHFRLVGHAYVHGIMHGEAWSSDQTELRTIGIV